MPDIGQYVIVRTKDAGVRCGEYRGHSGREVHLSNFRQMFRWTGGRLTLVDVEVVPGEVTLSRVNPDTCVLSEFCAIDPVSKEVEHLLRTTPHS